MDDPVRAVPPHGTRAGLPVHYRLPLALPRLLAIASFAFRFAQYAFIFAAWSAREAALRRLRRTRLIVLIAVPPAALTVSLVARGQMDTGAASVAFYGLAHGA